MGIKDILKYFTSKGRAELREIRADDYMRTSPLYKTVSGELAKQRAVNNELNGAVSRATIEAKTADEERDAAFSQRDEALKDAGAAKRQYGDMKIQYDLAQDKINGLTKRVETAEGIVHKTVGLVEKIEVEYRNAAAENLKAFVQSREGEQQAQMLEVYEKRLDYLRRQRDALMTIRLENSIGEKIRRLNKVPFVVYLNDAQIYLLNPLAEEILGKKDYKIGLSPEAFVELLQERSSDGAPARRDILHVMRGEAPSIDIEIKKRRRGEMPPLSLLRGENALYHYNATTLSGRDIELSVLPITHQKTGEFIGVTILLEDPLRFSLLKHWRNSRVQKAISRFFNPQENPGAGSLPTV